jgi:hypothetical protein
MNPGDLLKNLALDTWYKALIYLGVVLFVISLIIEVKGLTNAQLELLSSGLFFFGLGEWKNRKVASTFKPPNAYTGPAGILTTNVRKPDALGLIFDGLGVVLFVIGLYSIIRTVI